MKIADVDDSIAAIASAPGGSWRGIIRATGPCVVQQLATCFQSDPPQPLARIRSAAVVAGQVRVGPPLEQAPCDLYLWPNQRSFTRQPAAELHTFGSPPLMEAVLQALIRSGMRLAEPGEFTMRAFLAGRLDLMQAEAVLGVIDARSQTQFQSALTQLAGGLSMPLQRLREDLLNLLAHLEAGLDFVEEDIEFISAAQLDQQLEEVQRQVGAIHRQMRSRGEVSEEPSVVLLGRPNVGKSRLLNALAGQPAALVAEVAGTTRDYVAVRVEMEGGAFRLVDTAGLEEVDGVDAVASLAQLLRVEQASRAGLQLWCLDSSRPLSAGEYQRLRQIPRRRRILVLTKTDLGPQLPTNELPSDDSVISTSSESGAGIAQLLQAIRQSLGDLEEGAAGVTITSVRCRQSLESALDHLSAARDAAKLGLGEEFVASEVRLALAELGKVVGAVYTDDILDRIFSRFCIGK